MTILTSKWAIAALIVVLVVVLLLVIGKKSVAAETSIDASGEQVWLALTEVSEIKTWNKVLVPAQGEMGTGNSIKYEFYQEEGGEAAAMDAKVVQLVPQKLINQRGGVPGILTFDHRYIIAPGEEVTTVTINEKYRGIMVPFWNPAPVEKAYERLLKQLKSHLENG